MTGYTGILLEEEVLLECLWSGNGEYVPYCRSMNMVKKYQPWDPTDPSSRAANNLQVLIAEALSIEDYSEVKLYTAVGSPLDIWHGIDGFVEWMGFTVTIDLTANPLKESYKADIIIHEDEIYDQEQLRIVAEQIAQLLQQKAMALNN